MEALTPRPARRAAAGDRRDAVRGDGRRRPRGAGRRPDRRAGRGRPVPRARCRRRCSRRTRTSGPGSPGSGCDGSGRWRTCRGRALVARFGEEGARLHARARGEEIEPFRPRRAPERLVLGLPDRPAGRRDGVAPVRPPPAGRGARRPGRRPRDGRRPGDAPPDPRAGVRPRGHARASSSSSSASPSRPPTPRRSSASSSPGSSGPRHRPRSSGWSWSWPGSSRPSVSSCRCSCRRPPGPPGSAGSSPGSP